MARQDLDLCFGARGPQPHVDVDRIGAFSEKQTLNASKHLTERHVERRQVGAAGRGSVYNPGQAAYYRLHLKLMLSRFHRRMLGVGRLETNMSRLYYPPPQPGALAAGKKKPKFD